MSSQGFLLSPEILTAKQLLATAAGSNNSRVTSFSLKLAKSDRRFFRNEITCRITTLPALGRREDATADAGLPHRLDVAANRR